MSDPFAPPSQERDPGRNHGPPAREYLRFALSRSLRLVALPMVIMLGVVLIRPDLPRWVAGLVGGIACMFWLPTSLWIASSRFLGRHADPRPLILNRSGEWMDRQNFRQWVRARATERILGMAVTIAFLLVWAPTVGVLYLFPLSVLAAGWATYLVVTNRATVTYADAHVAITGGDPEAAIGFLAPIFERPRVNAALLDAALLLRARCHQRLGAFDEALADLDAITGSSVREEAVFARAEILLARGETALARQLLVSPPLPGLAQEICRETLRGLLAALDGTPLNDFPDPALNRRMPPPVRALWACIAAAAHPQQGRVGLDVDRDEVRWVAQAWPAIWERVREGSPRAPRAAPGQSEDA